MENLIDPRLIWEKIGIRDHDTNVKYYQSKICNVTEEDIELLNPDKINNNIFWEHVRHIDNNSICGFDQTQYGAGYINRENIRLLGHAGVLYRISETLSPISKIIEFGPGYGSFYQWLPSYTYSNYIGFDPYPTFALDKVIKTLPNGTIDRYYIKSYKNEFDLAVSSNVFQHMSLNQVKTYINDAYCLLKSGGTFIAMNFCYHNNCPPYIYTGGQFIPRMFLGDFHKLLIEAGFNIVSFYNSNETGCCTCTLRKT